MTNRQHYQLNNLEKVRTHIYEDKGTTYMRVLYKGKIKTEIVLSDCKGLKGDILKKAGSRKFYQWLDSEYE